jgi:hypothetical protein
MQKNNIEDQDIKQKENCLVDRYQKKTTGPAKHPAMNEYFPEAQLTYESKPSRLKPPQSTLSRKQNSTNHRR